MKSGSKIFAEKKILKSGTALMLSVALLAQPAFAEENPSEQNDEDSQT